MIENVKEGMRVRVREDRDTPPYNGLTGTIVEIKWIWPDMPNHNGEEEPDVIVRIDDYDEPGYDQWDQLTVVYELVGINVDLLDELSPLEQLAMQA